MRGSKEVVVAKLDAGVAFDELASASKLLSDSQLLRVATNLIPNGTGGLRTRQGCQSLVTGLTSQFLATFDPGYVIDATYTAIGVTDLSTNVRKSIKGGYTFTSGLPAWVQAPVTGGQGPFFGMNGVDTPFYWNGDYATPGTLTAWTASAGAVPNCNKLAVVGNRVWAAGDPNNPSRVYYTSLSGAGAIDPRNWDSTPPNDGGFIDLAQSDGTVITALVAWQEYLLVFKERKIFVFYDPFGGAANRPVNTAVGALAFGSIFGIGQAVYGAAVATPYGVVFAAADTTYSGLGQFRLYITDGTSVRPLGHLPGLTFQQTGSRQPSLTFTGNRIYMVGAAPYRAGSTGRSSGPVIVYDFDTTGWFTLGIDDLQGANVFESPYQIAVARDPSTATHRMYGVGGTSGRLWRLFSDDQNASDAGTAYKWYLLTSWHSLGSRTRRKNIETIALEATGTVAVETMLDGDYSTLNAQGLSPNHNQPDFQVRVDTPPPARLLALRLSGQASAGFALYSYAIEFTPRAD